MNQDDRDKLNRKIGTKKCSKCKDIKAVDEFHIEQSREDGRQRTCKECRKVVARSPEERERKSAYGKTPRGREVRKGHDRRHNQKHPDRKSVRDAAKNAVRDGRLIRQPCEVCGEPKSEGHHPDYKKPLNVRWLCKKHHTELHCAVLDAGEEVGNADGM